MVQIPRRSSRLQLIGPLFLQMFRLLLCPLPTLPTRPAAGLVTARVSKYRACSYIPTGLSSASWPYTDWSG